MTSAIHREVKTKEPVCDVGTSIPVVSFGKMCSRQMLWRENSILAMWSMWEQRSRDVWPSTCLNMYLPSFPTPHWEKGLGGGDKAHCTLGYKSNKLFV
ncbi:hypothetical protein QQF64_021040 [Cirrhinus molitorella]|uniref:Uncharacterized protein n=1 Tax=Cirrhinus molitorella TaxID=172907 RepID=A0ABR3LCB7_9TELE